MSKSQGVRRVSERVPIDTAMHRAMRVVADNKVRGRDTLANEIGYAVWPGAKFLHPQGAALAAGRVIGELKRRKLIRSSGRGWGLR